MEWYLIVAVVLVGFVAGFINTLAGSGSLLSLPMLIFLGLPANVANGTNRIAILLQNVVGVSSFKQQKILSFRQNIFLAIPAIVGSVVGASLAVDLNEALMEKIIGGLLVFMFFLVILNPKRWIEGKGDNLQTKPNFWNVLVFFAIGIYGGFIQAGVGFFWLAALVLGVGYDLVRANAVKLFIILLYTPFALAVFILNDQVNYLLGFILAVGNMLGAFVASKFAVSWGAKVVRYFLLGAILISSAKLFGLF